MRKLVRLAREYEALRGPDLPGFLHFVDAQAGPRPASPRPRSPRRSGDAVRLMTIHSAKGLEFPVVVVADCGRGRRAPARRSSRLPEGSFGFRVPDATAGKLRDPTAYRDVLQAEKEASCEEQRRVSTWP